MKNVERLLLSFLFSGILLLFTSDHPSTKVPEASFLKIDITENPSIAEVEGVTVYT